MLHAIHRLRITALASIVQGILATVQSVKEQENITNSIESFEIIENSALKLQSNLRSFYTNRWIQQADHHLIKHAIDRLEDWTKFLFLETRQFRFIKDNQIVIIDVQENILIEDPYFHNE